MGKFNVIIHLEAGQGPGLLKAMRAAATSDQLCLSLERQHLQTAPWALACALSGQSSDVFGEKPAVRLVLALLGDLTRLPAVAQPSDLGATHLRAWGPSVSIPSSANHA